MIARMRSDWLSLPVQDRADARATVLYALGCNALIVVAKVVGVV